jgi:putative transcriptional regulator
MKGISGMKKLDLSKFERAKTFEIKYLDIDKLVDNRFVKNLRKKLNMTQLVFASVIGVTKKTVEKWEQGKNPVKGAAARFLYLLDLKPELINEFYVVNSYNTEIAYFVEYCMSYKETKNESANNYIISGESENCRKDKDYKKWELTYSA